MPAWISVTGQMGLTYPGSIDSTKYAAVGTIVRFRNETLGEGEFIYLSGAASVAAGTVCSFQITYNASVATSTVAPWPGADSTPVPLAIATAATVAGTYGWYQLSGSAIVKSSGTVVSGDTLYWQSAGVVSSTVVAGKQMLNAIAVSANGVPATNQVIVTIDRPLAQGVVATVPAGDITIPAGDHFTIGQATAAGPVDVAPFAQFGAYDGGSLPNWFGRGAQIDMPSQTYTDTTVASGVSNSVYFANWGSPTVAASSAGVTFTRAATFKINSPHAGANVTITHSYAINTSDDNSFEGKNALGTLTPSAWCHVGGDDSVASWTTTGVSLAVNNNTFSDNSSTVGTTINSRTCNSMGIPTFAFDLGASTISDAYALLLRGDPVAGTNATITRAWTLGVLGNAQITGKTATSASTTGRAGLNVPHGTAPTSPVDGDMWTTTAGLFVRINGSTVGPLS